MFGRDRERTRNIWQVLFFCPLRCILHANRQKCRESWTSMCVLCNFNRITCQPEIQIECIGRTGGPELVMDFDGYMERRRRTSNNVIKCIFIKLWFRLPPNFCPHNYAIKACRFHNWEYCKMSMFSFTITTTLN